MKTLLIAIFFTAIGSAATAQTQISKTNQPDSTKAILIVDASCGQCQFGLKGDGCSLAVRINKKSYFVDGADIDAYGDAHAHDGFCEAIRKAEVQGEVVDNRFKATYFKLLDESADKKKNKK